MANQERPNIRFNNRLEVYQHLNLLKPLQSLSTITPELLADLPPYIQDLVKREACDQDVNAIGNSASRICSLYNSTVENILQYFPGAKVPFFKALDDLVRNIPSQDLAQKEVVTRLLEAKHIEKSKQRRPGVHKEVTWIPSHVYAVGKDLDITVKKIGVAQVKKRHAMGSVEGALTPKKRVVSDGAIAAPPFPDNTPSRRRLEDVGKKPTAINLGPTNSAPCDDVTTHLGPESLTKEMKRTPIVISDTESDGASDHEQPNPEYFPDGEMLRELANPKEWVHSRPLDKALEILSRAFRPSTYTFDSGMLEGTPSKNSWLSQYLTKSNQGSRMVGPMENGNHWVALCLNPENASVDVYDSFQALDIHRTVTKALDLFLPPPAWTYNHLECPQQSNKIDCGVFVFHFLCCILLDLPPPERTRSSLWRRIMCHVISEPPGSWPLFESPIKVPYQAPKSGEFTLGELKKIEKEQALHIEQLRKHVKTRAQSYTNSIATMEEDLKAAKEIFRAFLEACDSASKISIEKITEMEDEKNRCEKWVIDAEGLHTFRTGPNEQLLAQIRSVILPEIRDMEKFVQKHKNEQNRLLELRTRLMRVLKAIGDAEKEIGAEKDQLASL